MLRTCVLIGAFAFAQAQFNFQSQNPARQQSSFQQRGQYQINNQYQQPANQYQQTSNQFQNTGNQYQNRANQYQNNVNQYQNSGNQRGSVGGCREKNERSPVPGSCDRYIECINGTAEEKVCPDGLRFNPDLKFNAYPCQYPIDVPCKERSALQPAEATEECPHQFGYFRLGDARNCSGFRNCVNGRGHDLQCPDGLAFNVETYQCDWPDLVADCDAEAFVGFTCPQIPVSKELGEPAGYRYYGSESNCQKYFVCVNGRPRGLSCGVDSGFDALTSACAPADEVPACPPELRERARRNREEETQRLARKNGAFRVQVY